MISFFIGLLTRNWSFFVKHDVALFTVAHERCFSSRRAFVTSLFRCSCGCSDSTASLTSRAKILAIPKTNPPNFPPPDLTLLQRDILFVNASVGHVTLLLHYFVSNNLDYSRTLDSPVPHTSCSLFRILMSRSPRLFCFVYTVL